MPLRRTVLVGLALALSVPSRVTATPPDVTFLCDQAPEICKNMCWAVRCANPSFSQELTFDFPDHETLSRRRQAAGCGRNDDDDDDNSDRCAGGNGNTWCDMYPFASTKEADQGHQVTRCVPASEGRYESAKIDALQREWKKQGKTSFLINFGNPGEVRYCNNDPCTNDGLELQAPAADLISRRRPDEPLFRYYRTRTGIVLASMEPMEAQASLAREVSSGEILHDGFDTWTEKLDVGEVRMVQDGIVEELPWDTFQSQR